MFHSRLDGTVRRLSHIRTAMFCDLIHILVAILWKYSKMEDENVTVLKLLPTE